MKYILFTLAFLLSLLFLSTKIFFFIHESLIGLSYISSLELIVLTVLFFLGVFTFIKEEKEISFSLSFDNKKLLFLYLALIFIFFTLSLYVNVKKESMDWDAVALYDARAHFLLNGYSFKTMNNLTNYDVKNKYYYLLYPPFTSTLHFFWYKEVSLSHVGIIYSFFLLIFGILLISLIWKKVKLGIALCIILLVFLQKIIFITSIIEYSNLPYSVYLLSSILLFNLYLQTQKKWSFYFALLLLIASLWIRFLEPIWLAILVSFILQMIKKFSLKKSMGISLVSVCCCFLSVISWNEFLYKIAHNEKIINNSLIIYAEPIVGIFTTSLFYIFISFLHMWGWFAFILILVFIPIKTKNEVDTEVGFFRTIILSCLIIYFSGLYFISFQFDWWPELGGSLVRSSSFLIPLCFYIIFKNVSSLIGKQ